MQDFPAFVSMIAEKDRSAKSRVIVWFRKDLRLRDNPALEVAYKAGKEIVPVCSRVHLE